MLKGEGAPDEVVKKHDYKIVEDNGAIEAAVDAAFEPTRTCREAQERQHEADGCNHRCRDEATRGQADAKAVTKVVMGKIKG